MLRVVGIENTDGNPAAACECCGTNCPKRRVVLADDNGDFRFYGVVCADLAVRGSAVKRSHATATAAIESEVARLDRERREANHRAIDAKFETLVAAVREDHPEVRPVVPALRRAARAGSLSERCLSLLLAFDPGALA